MCYGHFCIDGKVMVNFKLWHKSYDQFCYGQFCYCQFWYDGKLRSILSYDVKVIVNFVMTEKLRSILSYDVKVMVNFNNDGKVMFNFVMT